MSNLIEALRHKESEVAEFRRSLKALTEAPTDLPLDTSQLPTLGKLQAMMLERPNPDHQAELLQKARAALVQSEAELADLKDKVEKSRAAFEEDRADFYQRVEAVQSLAVQLSVELLALANAGNALNAKASSFGERAIWADFGHFHPTSIKGPVVATVVRSGPNVSISSAKCAILAQSHDRAQGVA